MSVRRRQWSTPRGAQRSGWQADYVDAKGRRRRKMFNRKKEADAFLLTARNEVREGVHVVDSETATVSQAGRLWLKSGEAAGLERGTIDQRERHLRLHIEPFIGDLKLNRITVPRVRTFQDQLREAGRKPATVKRVTISLGSIFADAQSRGLTVRNPVHERSRARPGAAEKRAKARLRVGVDIPSPAEVKAFLASLTGRWRPILIAATFTGMRSSELRGLRWFDVDFDAKRIYVRQRADAYNTIGRPKSKASERAIPMSPILVNTLREWRLACPRRDTGRVNESGEPVKALDLVFPSGAGNVETRGNVVKRGLIPAMISAGLTIDTGKIDEKGKPILAAKYSGLHSLRHFYASWCLNPVASGGQGLPPKAVQERLGHASIAMTMDVYGHLFPVDDEHELMAAAERSLLT